MAEIGISVVVRGVAEARRGIGNVQSDINSLGRTISSVSGTTSALGTNLQAIGNSLIGVGRSLTVGVTAPILAAGAAAIAAGIEFEAAFAGVGKTVEGVMTSTGQLTDLGEQIRQEFRDMALEVPIATNELAHLGEVVGQLGVRAEDVAEITEIIAMLGATTELAAEDAARGLIRFANNLGVAASDMEQFLLSAGSAIVALGNSSVSTEGEILNLTLRLAAAGDRAHFSAQEILAWATTLSDLGVRAEMGGSAVSRAINEMLFAVQSGSDNLGTFANVVDMTVNEFVTAFEQDASGALAHFISSLEEGIRTGRVTQEMLADLGLSGIRAMDVLGRLGDAESLFAKNLEIANMAWEEQVALQEEFNKRSATIQAQIQLLKNAFTDLGITIFDLVRDDITSLIKGIRDLVGDFKKLDPNIQKAIIQFALMAAAVGPILIVLGGLIAGLGLFISGIGALLSPVGLATVGILALGAALTAIVLPNLSGILGDLDSIKEKALDIARALGFIKDVPVAAEGAAPVNAVQAEQAVAGGETAPTFAMPSPSEFIQNLKELGGEEVTRAIDAIDRIGEGFNKLFTNISNSEAVSASLEGIGKSLSGIGQTLVDFSLASLEGFGEWINENADELTKVAEGLLSVGDALSWVAEGLLKVAEPIATGVLSLLGESLSLLLNILEGDWEGAGQNVSNALLAIEEASTGVNDAVLEVGTALAGSTPEEFSATWQGVFENLGIIFTEGGQQMQEQNQSNHDALIQANSNVQHRFDEGAAAWKGIFDNVGAVISSFATNASTGMQNFASAISTGFSLAVSNAASFIGNMLATGTAFIQGAINGVNDRIKALIDAVSTGAAGAAASFAGFISSFAASGSSFMESARASINDRAKAILAAASEAASSAAGAFEGFVGDFSAAGAAFIQGAIGGIESLVGDLVAAAAGAAAEAAGAFMGALQIQSPSKVMFEAGQFFIQGTILGINDQIAALNAATQTAALEASVSFADTFQSASVVDTLVSALSSATAPSSSIVNNNQQTNFSFGDISGVPMRDETDLPNLLAARLKLLG